MADIIDAVATILSLTTSLSLSCLFYLLFTLSSSRHHNIYNRWPHLKLSPLSSCYSSIICRSQIERLNDDWTKKNNCLHILEIHNFVAVPIYTFSIGFKRALKLFSRSLIFSSLIFSRAIECCSADVVHNRLVLCIMVWTCGERRPYIVDIISFAMHCGVIVAHSEKGKM